MITVEPLVFALLFQMKLQDLQVFTLFVTNVCSVSL